MQFTKVTYPCGGVSMPSFYRLPRQLIYNSQFSRLSCEAKLLYCLLLDRLSLSMANGWFDEHRQVYVYFTVHEVALSLGCGRCKALKVLEELDTETGIGLIKRERQCLCKPDRIYVKLLPEMGIEPVSLWS